MKPLRGSQERKPQEIFCRVHLPLFAAQVRKRERFVAPGGVNRSIRAPLRPLAISFRNDMGSNDITLSL
jgi:hypothetical protein